MKDSELSECPECLGLKETYNFYRKRMIQCKTCKGEGFVIEDEYNVFIKNLV